MTHKDRVAGVEQQWGRCWVGDVDDGCAPRGFWEIDPPSGSAARVLGLGGALGSCAPQLGS